MLTSVHTLLRRHRRRIRWAVAVIAICTSVLTAHSVAMSDGMSDHTVGDAAALCIAVGGSFALAGAGVFSGPRRPSHRPAWLIDVPAAQTVVFIGARSGSLVRAGPPGSQVLRL